VERLKIIEYKGKEIVCIDYRGLIEDEEVIEFVREATDYVIGLERPSLQLTDVSNVFFTPPIMEVINQCADEAKSYVLKDAIIGIKGAKRILFQLYSMILGGKARAFSDDVSAKEWLVSD
jgi:hypothetical protein